MPQYKICVARPHGTKLNCPEIGSWLGRWTAHLAMQRAPIGLEMLEVSNPRIAMMRNSLIETAIKKECSHVLMFDPDMAIDRYCNPPNRDPNAKPFWDVAWPFVLNHTTLLDQNQKPLGPCVAAAPYCGAPPHYPVHVFVGNQKNNLVRVDHKTAAQQRGWTQIRAVGTGLMLIDMAVFDKLDRPFFRDTFTDHTAQSLLHSQDVNFCLRCETAGVPIYVNWDCWCGHWQMAVAEKPGWMPPKTEPDEIPVAAHPEVPKLQIWGQGDKSWG